MRAVGHSVIASEAKQSSPAPVGALQDARRCMALFGWRASRALDCFVAALLAMTLRRFAISFFKFQTARLRQAASPGAARRLSEDKHHRPRFIGSRARHLALAGFLCLIATPNHFLRTPERACGTLGRCGCPQPDVR